MLNLQVIHILLLLTETTHATVHHSLLAHTYIHIIDMDAKFCRPKYPGPQASGWTGRTRCYQ